jgi:phosphoglycolate phosphatase
MTALRRDADANLQAAEVGLLFDLDNTLVASHIDFTSMRRAVVAQLEEAGLALTAAQRHWPVGRLAALAQEPEAPAGLHDLIWRTIEAYEMTGMVNAKPAAGAVAVAGTLATRGHPLGVLTNNSRASALTVLESAALLPFFRLVLCREDVPRLKPEPDGVNLARALLGSPKRLVVIGDSWLDGLAAQAGHALFVAVGDYCEGPEPCPVWRRVPDLHGILQVDLLV